MIAGPPKEAIEPKNWEEWLSIYFPNVAYAPMAERHVRLWTWFDNLRRGEKPPPQIEIWARGSGKSTSTELGVARLATTLNRRFVLYVSEIQDQADSHVQSISTYLEKIGAEPLLNKMGRARGWRRNQLRTSNGFNVAGFGMDNTQRGIKIDEFRPDLIIFDDVDNRHDSIENVRKKIEGMTQTIMPTGSPDCAILFVQNMVHSNSIAAQFVDGRAKFLLDRVVPVPVPAVEGLRVKPIEAESGVTRYQIIEGTPTWAGQSLATCEMQINEWGLDAFEREAQHQVAHSGDLFFPKFEGSDFPVEGLDGRHIAQPFDVPTWWTWFMGYDDGRFNPAAGILFALSPLGYVARGVSTVFAVEEFVASSLSADQRAQRCEALIEKYGLEKRRVVIYADPSTWSKQVDSDMIGRAPIEKFFSRGLAAVKANNNRPHGLDNLVEYVTQANAFKIFKGRCPELERQFKTAVHSKVRVEDLDDDADISPSHMDAISAGRYGLHSRVIAPAPAEQPEAIYLPWMEAYAPVDPAKPGYVVPLRSDQLPAQFQQDRDRDEYEVPEGGGW